MVSGFGVNEQQVAYGVVVFGSVQPAKRDVTRVGVLGIDVKDAFIDPTGNGRPLIGRGRVLPFGRHDMGFEVLPDLVPCLMISEAFPLVWVLIQFESALARSIPMTVVAIPLEQWQRL